MLVIAASTITPTTQPTINNKKMKQVEPISMAEVSSNTGLRQPQATVLLSKPIIKIVTTNKVIELVRCLVCKWTRTDTSRKMIIA